MMEYHLIISASIAAALVTKSLGTVSRLLVAQVASVPLTERRTAQIASGSPRPFSHCNHQYFPSPKVLLLIWLFLATFAEAMLCRLPLVPL